MKIKKVMVIGAGQMGSGIAQVNAQAGFDVLLYDANQEAIEKGLQHIEKLLIRAVDKERITEERENSYPEATPASEIA